MAINYIPRNQIDDHKWNRCIANSVNGIAYAYTWYLDIVAERWDALVNDDYSAVFPLVHGSRLGIRYLYQPYFTQQLGLFSGEHLKSESVDAFIQAIPAHFRYIDINLNSYNQVSLPSANVTQRVTYLLDLIEPYPAICGRFSNNTKRNISKSVAFGASVSRGVSISDMVKLKKDNQAVPLSKKHVTAIQMVISHAISNGIGEIYGAYSKRNQLCAAAFFLKSNGRAIYLISASNDEGKELRAMFAIIDHFIHQNSESHLVLDFEGSNIESIARFFGGFGAKPTQYPHVEINRLPWPLKLLK